MITTSAAGCATPTSLLVTTEKLASTYVFAAGLTMPPIDSDLAVPVAAAQVPPLSASVISTAEPVVDPVAEQFTKPAPSVIVGVATMLAGAVENAEGKVAVIVSPAASAPTLVGVNPTAHDAAEPAVCGVPAKVTACTALLPMTTAGGDAGVASKSVSTVNVPGPYDPELGLVIPAMVTVLLETFACVQVPPLLARVIVTSPLFAVAVAEQLVNPAGRVIVGPAGTVNAGSNCTKMRCPAPSAAVALLGRTVTDHVEVTPPVCGLPLNATLVGAVAGAMVMSPSGCRARRRCRSTTKKPSWLYGRTRGRRGW